MKGRKRFHRILAFILALVTGFTTFVTSPEAVYANDEGGNVDFEANISLTPDVNDVVMGNPGSFTLVAQAANPNADKNYEVRIDLPAGSQDWIQGFSSQPTEPGGSYYLNTSVNWLYLYKPNDGSRPYLYFTITNGDIRQTNIAFRPPAGTLSDFELSVSEEDIQVWYEDDVETPIGGTVVKEGGSMYFRNTFDWNPVQKTVDPTSVQVDENGNMASDLTYTVTTSTTDASDLLGMFTRTVTLTDTLTLPGSASFVEGEMRLENGGSGLWNIYIGDVLAGVVQQQNSGSDITTSLTDVQVTGGNTLTFTYTQSTIYTEETAAQYTAEMSAPVYTLTLKKEAVDFTADSISAADIIRNDVGFYAVSWDSTMEDSSSATASTVPVAPGADFTVEKTASSVSWNDETETMDIAWQITVTNTGMLTLDDMVVTDVLPDSLEVTDPVNFTEEGGNYVLRIDEPLAPGDNIVETIQTSVKPNTLTDGATVVNNVSVTAEGITKNGSAQTVYQSPQAPLVMTKDIVVRNEENIETGTLSQVYEGQTFTYEIEVTPNSGASNSFSITELYDVLPEGLTFVSAEIGRWQVVVNGSDQQTQWSPYINEVSYDEETRQVSVNGPISGQDSVVLRITVTVDDDVYQPTEINTITNTAHATGSGSDPMEASKSVTVRERQPNLNISKSADMDGESIRLDQIDGTDVTDAVYKAHYYIDVRNNGDLYLETDGTPVTDVMSGGLQPVRDVSAGSGTVEATASLGDWNETITGTWERTGTDETGMPEYTITYVLPHDIATEETLRIEYDAYVDMSTFGTTNIDGLRGVTLSNQASIYGITGDGIVTEVVKPRIEVNKGIAAINGERFPEEEIADNKHSEVAGRNKITYQLTVANTGNRGTFVDISDILPNANEGYRWIYGDNVTAEVIAGNAIQSMVPNLEENGVQQSLMWEDVPIQAGEEIVIEVTLTYCDTVADFEIYFSNLWKFENTLDVGYKDPYEKYDANEKAEWTSTVTHDAVFLDAGITKTADREYAYQNGDTVTYTINGFDTDASADDYQISDNMSEVRDRLTFASVKTGSYDIRRNYADADSYTLEVTAVSPSGEESTAQITVNAGTNTELTYNQIIEQGGFEADSFIKELRWKFGDIDELHITEAPQVNMTASTRSVVTGLPNTATVFTSGKSQAQSIEEISIIPIQQLTKTASDASNGALLGDGLYDGLEAGDRVNFDITYVNAATTPLDASTKMIYDYLTVGGVKAGEYDVTYTLYNKEGEEVKSETVTGGLQITEEDIASAMAKRTVFTAPEGFIIDGAEEAGSAGGSLKISYQIELSADFDQSIIDYRGEKHDRWGFDENNSIIEPENMYILHNRAMIIENGNTIMDETGYYYFKGENSLMIRKSVLGTGTFNSLRSPGGGSLHYSYYLSRDVNGRDFNNVPGDREDVDDLKFLGNKFTNFSGDIIRYMVLIANDSLSSESITIKDLNDILPTGSGDNTYIYGLPRNNSQDWNGGVASFYSSKYYEYTAWRSSAGSMLSTTATNALQNNAAKLPTGYSFKQYYAERTNTTKISLYASSAKNALVLEPGESIALVYFVSLPRGDSEPDKYTNRIELTINKTNEPFEIMDADTVSTFESKISTRNESRGVTHNDGTVEKVSDTVFASEVDLYPIKTSLGIQKNATAKIEGNFDESSTISQVKTGTRNTDLSSLRFGDIVEFEISVQNGIASSLSGYTLKDTLPYPYKIVTETDDTGTVVGETSDGNPVYGTVEDIPDADFGTGSQTVTFNTSAGSSLQVSGNSVKTIKVYAVYTGVDNMAMEYTNRVEIYPASISNFVLLNGEPIYDESGTMTGAYAVATVHPEYGFDSGSRLTINSDGSMATGGGTPNSVKADEQGDTVLYTMYVENKSSTDYENVVLINRLPVTDDVGTVNARIGRDSEFKVNLTQDVLREYLASGLTAEYQITDVETAPSDDGWQSADDFLQVTTADKSSGYTTADWNGTGEDWTSYDSAAADTYGSVRFVFPSGLPANKTLVVRFTAEVGSDALPGELAYDSFGYSFTSGSRRYYAEPAKVGLEIDHTSVSGTKVWDDDGYMFRPNPENTPVALYKSVDGGEPQQVTDAQITWTATEGDEWSFTFDNLPVTENGMPVTYTIGEGEVPGYRGSVVDNGDGTFTVTNVRDVVTISGTKTWVDDGNAYLTRPDNIELILLSRTEATAGAGDFTGEFTRVNNAPDCTWTKEGDQWTYTFTNLPAYDSYGRAIQYQVQEGEVPGYSSSGDDNGNFVNTASDTTLVSVIKSWEDDSDSYGMRPDSIQVQLYANGDPIGGAVTLSANGSGTTVSDGVIVQYGPWSCAYRNLDKFDENGVLISYTIEEVSHIDGYESAVERTVSENGNTSFVITNTFDAASAQFAGTKTLTGRELADREFAFELYEVSDDGQETLIQTVRNSGSEFVFDRVFFGRTGTYNYKIVERNDGLDGIFYDDTVHWIRANVTMGAAGDYAVSLLRAETSGEASEMPDRSAYTPYNAGDASQISFENRFSERGTAILQAQKVLENMDIAADMYAFTVTPVNGTSGEASGEAVSAANRADGSIVFPVFEYDTPGTYYYQMAETAGSEEGILYDGRVYDIRVIVSSTGTVNMATDISYALHVDGTAVEDQAYQSYTGSADLVFTNTYTELTTDITLRKELTGDGAPRLADGQFSFTIEGGNLEAPVTVSNNAEGSIVFEDIDTYTSADTYTYTVTEHIPEAGDADFEPSITYDNGTITVAVTVELQGKALVVTDITYDHSNKTSGDESVFTNVWTKASPGSAQIKAVKLYSDAEDGTNVAIAQDEFSFRLSAADGTPMPEGAKTGEDGVLYKDATTAEGDGAGSAVDFGSITYEEEGIYEYTITEIEGSDPSVSYDTRTVNVTVTVTKNEDNKLVADPTYAGGEQVGDDENGFVNTYTEPAPGSAQISAVKTYTETGTEEPREILADQFSLTLTAVDGAPMPEGSTDGGETAEDYKTVDVPASEDGTTPVNFGSITYDTEGTYRYTITETRGSDPSVTYDQRTVNVTVNVTKDTEENKLVANPTYAGGEVVDGGEKGFVNTYTQPSPGSAEISAAKMYRDAEGSNVAIPENVFRFRLRAAEGTPMPADAKEDTDGSFYIDAFAAEGNGAGSPVDFGSITYEAEGTYYYTIAEIEGSIPGVTYDNRTVNVTVNVTKDTEENKLVANPTYAGGEVVDGEEKGFVNTYTEPSPGSAQIEAAKLYRDAEGSNVAIPENVFTFRLTAVDGAPMPADAKEGEGGALYIDATAVAGDGSGSNVDFGSITYDTEGTYYYTITEIDGSVPGVTYDNRTVNVTVNVTRDPENKLKAVPTYEGGEQVGDNENGFVNTYTEPDPGSAEISAAKMYRDAEGSNVAIPENVFTFRLTAVDGAPMPADAKEGEGGALYIDATAVAGDGAGSPVDFGSITYDTEGTYRYTITEIEGSDPSVTYDTTTVNVTVTVTRNEDNDLVAVPTYEGGEMVGDAANGFVNTYTEPGSGRAEIRAVKTYTVTGTGEPRAILEKQFSLTLTAVDGAPMPAGYTDGGDEADYKTVEVPAGDGTGSTVNFGNISYTSEGTYKYIITETKGSDPSVAYDTRTVNVTVNVTRNQDNVLEAVPTYEGGEVVDDDENGFVNTYTEPDPGSAQIKAIKTYTDTEDDTNVPIEQNEFAFRLSAVDGAPMPADAEAGADGVLYVDAFAAAGDGSGSDVDFGSITYNTEGIYYYTITEIKASVPGVTYDTRTVNVTVNVTKNTENKLEAVPTYEDGVDVGGTENGFANTYTEPDPGSAEIAAVKTYTVTGTGEPREILEDQFSLTLTAVDGAPMPAGYTDGGDEADYKTVEVPAGDGTGSTVNFGNISYTSEGTYEYIITETKGSDPSVAYDTRTVNVTVNVTRNQDNVLEAVPTYEGGEVVGGEEKGFVNTYTQPGPGSTEISAVKMYRNEDGTDMEIAEDVFRFRLRAAEGTPMPADAKQDTDGSFYIDATAAAGDGSGSEVKFDSITYDTEGTYYYTIAEIEGSVPGVTYDNRTVNVTVNVTRNPENKLEAVPTYAGGAVVDSTANGFVNTYTEPDPGSAQIAAVKMYRDADGTNVAIAEDVFTFRLTAVDGAPMPAGAQEGDDGALYIDATAAAGDGTGSEVNFGSITYEAEGIYEYTITEIEGSDPSVTYDGRTVTVSVSVEKNGANVLKAVPTYAGGEVAGDEANGFVNTYTEPDPGSAEIGAVKMYRDAEDGSNVAIAQDEFTFRLRAAEGTPMPTGAQEDTDGSFYIDATAAAGDGTGSDVDFGSITYDTEGTYYYTITEIKGSVPGVTYDKRTVNVTVNVTRNPENKLEAVPTYADGEMAGDDANGFVNTYTEPDPGSAEIGAVKMYRDADGTNVAIPEDVFTFRLTAVDGAPMPADAEEGEGGALYIDATAAAGDGTGSDVDFGSITYDTEGTYHYTITEIEGSDPSVTYDARTVNVTVNVTRNSENELKAVPTYTGGEVAGDEANGFVNTYTEPDPDSAEIKAVKTYTVAGTGEPRAILEKQFSLTLTAVDGAPMPAGYTDGGDEADYKTVEVPAGEGTGSTVNFGNISYTSEGTYEYIITETEGSEPGISYDGRTVRVTVNVNNTEANGLEAEVVYADGVEVNGVANGFTNTYTTPDPDTAEFKVTKRLEDADGTPVSFGDRVFTFTIEPQNGAPAPERSTVTTSSRTDTEQPLSFGVARFSEDPGTGSLTYTYLIRETEGSDPSITYDDEVITATVTVTKLESNDLHAEVTYTKPEAETGEEHIFTNVYTEPGSGSTSIEAVKTYTVAGTDDPRAIEGGEFSLTLTAVDGAPMPTGSTDGGDGAEDYKTVNVPASQDGTTPVEFGTITYDTEGTYYYTITETKGSDPSVTYDTRTVNVTVTVTKNEDNKLVAVPTYAGGEEIKGKANGFANAYTAPDPDSASISAFKTYTDTQTDTGRAIAENEFLFILESVDGAPMPEGSQPGDDTTPASKSVYVPADDDGNVEVVFGSIEYTSEGTYEYTITEQKGEDPSVTYDTAVIRVTVEVEKNADNDLVAEVTYEKNGDSTEQGRYLNNWYTAPGDGTASIKATKNLRDHNDNLTAIPADAFSLTLTAVDNAPMPAGAQSGALTVDVPADADGSSTVDFGTISYNAEGEYEYTITEVEGDDPSMSYDSGVVNVTVSVEKGSDNILKPTVTYTKAQTEGGTEVSVFDNTYTAPDPASEELQIRKMLVDADERPVNFADRTFTFTVTPLEGAPAPAQTEVTTTASDAAEDTLSFGEIQFTADPVDGSLTYRYEIRETIGGDPSITYDKGVITATVTVTKDENNDLKAQVAYSKPGAAENENDLFTNIYTAPTPTKAELEIIKNFEDVNGNPVNFGDNVFTFTVEPQNGAPEPEQLTVFTDLSEASEQTLSFGEIEFTEDVGLTAGASKTYTYEITETAGDAPSVTYDGGTVTASVTVTKEEDNTLRAEVTYSRPDVEPDAEPGAGKVFTNVYTAPEPAQEEILINKTFEDPEGGAVSFGGHVFTFTIEPQNGAPAPELTEVSTTQGEASDQQLSFGNIEFTEDVGIEEGAYKEYTYIIRETAGADPSVTYDQGTITATVTVTKNEENELITEVTYEKDGESVAEAEFTNIYDSPQPTSASLSIEKLFEDAAGTPRNFGDNVFNFTVEPQNGAPEPEWLTVSTDLTDAAEQTLSFGNIRFTEDVGLTAGSSKEYTYVIRETAGDNPSITYDSGTVTATVTVTKDEDNRLNAEVAYSRSDAEQGEEKVFTNVYTAPEPVQTELSVGKMLEDPDGGAVDFGGNVFTFTVEPQNGAPAPEWTEVSTTESGVSQQRLSFGNITFTEDVGLTAGSSKEYTYVIRETAGSNPSITYDSGAITATVTVTKNEDNKLTTDVVYSNPDAVIGRDSVFTNIYNSPTPTVAALEINKMFEDPEGNPVNFGDNVFTFTVEPQNGAPEPANLTVSTSASDTSEQTLSFGNIQFSEDVGLTAGSSKEYTYVIRETVGDNPSITYDSGAVTAVVTVTKDEHNTLHAEVAYSRDGAEPGEENVFTNVYTQPVPAEAELLVDKTFADAEGNLVNFGDNVFTFTVEPQNGAPVPQRTEVSTTESGASQERLSFGSITFAEDVGIVAGASKEYTYLIRETDGDNPSITYDGTAVTATVTVTKNADNELVAEVSYEKDGTAGDSAQFANIYNEPKPVQTEIIADKSFVTADGEAFDFGGNVFSFTITPQDGAPEPERLTVSTSAVDAAEETVSFGNVTFDEDTGVTAGTTKTYTYVIAETTGTNPSVDYDGNAVTVTVTVTKNEANELTAEVAYEKAGEPADEAGFVNTYNLPEPTEAEIAVDKSFITSEGGEFDFGGNIFTFTIEPQNGAPEPENTTVSTDLEDVSRQTLSFGNIRFTEDVGLTAGSSKDYVYLIRETAGDNPSVTYDDAVITATVTVTKDAENRLNAEVAYSRPEAAAGSEDVFTNIYTLPEPTQAELFVTKAFASDAGAETVFGDNIFSFTVEPQDGAPAPEHMTVSTSQADAAEQTLSFGNIQFTEDVGLTAGSSKDYVYLIRETAGENPSVTYDGKTVTATVTVTKDADNRLNAEVAYSLEEEEVENAQFDNIYTSPEPVESELFVSKLLMDETGEGIDFADSIFTFTIAPVDGAPVPERTEVSTDATDAYEQTLSFGNIRFTEDPGITAGSEKVYTYVISEMEGDNPSVTYNTGSVTAQITVRKTADNRLEIAGIEYTDEEGTVLAQGQEESPTVENLYTAPEPVDVVFGLDKIYEGHDLLGEDFEFELVDENGEVIQTVANDEEGHIMFEPVTFAEDPGYGTLIYEFTVREIDSENPSITYDGDEVSITVAVTKTEENTLAAEVTYTKAEEDVTEQPYFNNIYTAPDPTEAVIELTKTYNGAALRGGDFRFVLTDEDGVELQTVTNDADGRIVFAPLTFDQDVEGKDGVNVYRYTIREVNTGGRYITYDDRVITAEITVSKNEDNCLEAEVTYYDEADNVIDGPGFVNTYTPPTVKTGDDMPDAAMLHMLLLALSAGIIGVMARKKKKA